MATDFEVYVKSSGGMYTTLSAAEAGVQCDRSVAVTGNYDNPSGTIADGAAVTWNAGGDSGTLVSASTTTDGPSDSYLIVETTPGTLEDNDVVSDGTNTFDVMGAPAALANIKIRLFAFNDTTSMGFSGSSGGSTSRWIDVFSDSSAYPSDGIYNETGNYWRSGKSRFVTFNDAYIKFHHIQMKHTETGHWQPEHLEIIGEQTSELHIYNNWLRTSSTGSGAGRKGFLFIGSNSSSWKTTAKYLVYNNIAYNFKAGSDQGFSQHDSNYFTIELYNNTSVNNTTGFGASATANQVVTAKGNLAQDNTTDYSSGIASSGAWDTSDVNVSEDGTSPDGSNYANHSVLFNHVPTDDYTISGTTDTVLDDAPDLSGTFTDDIEGVTRSTWYAGFSEGSATSGEFTKDLSDTLNMSDTLVKDPAKPLSDTLNMSDVLERACIKELNDSLTLSDSIARTLNRALSDTLTLTDTLAKSLSRTIADALTLSDTCVKVFSKTLSENVNLTDTIIRLASKSFIEPLSLSDTLTKITSRIFTDGLTLTDVLEILPTKILTETLTLTDALVKVSTKNLPETLTLSDVLEKEVGKVLTDSLTLTDSLLKGRVKELLETLTLTDTISRDTTKTLSEVLTLTDTITKLLNRTLSENVSLSDVDITKTVGKLLSEVLTLNDSLLKSITRDLTDTLNVSDTLNKETQKVFTDVLSLSDTLLQTLVKILVLNEVLSLSDTVVKDTQRTLTDTITLSDTITSSLIELIIQHTLVHLLSEITTERKLSSKVTTELKLKSKIDQIINDLKSRIRQVE